MNKLRRRFLEYQFVGSPLDLTTHRVLAFTPSQRRVYVRDVLVAMSRAMRRDRFTLKKGVTFQEEMRALRRLVREPAGEDCRFWITDDYWVTRSALGTKTPAHSEHTCWAGSAMWRMETKTGSLQRDVSAAIRKAKPKGKTLFVRLCELLDPAKTSKAAFRESKTRVLPLIYSFIESHYGLRAAFPPFHAKFFADRYLPLDRDSIVVDPCAGWGGRLLGTLCVARKKQVSYLGVDPNHRLRVAYRGLTRRATVMLREDIGGPRKATVRCAPFERWLRTAEARRLRGRVDLVMTSPPYAFAENYDPRNKEQSANQFASYDQWREHFYSPLIKGAFRLLRPGGTFVLNVANVAGGRSLERDARSIAKAVGFKWHEYFKLLMPLGVGTRAEDAVSVRKPKKGKHMTYVNGAAYKHEPVMCFRKPT